MNTADSQRLASELERMGITAETDNPEEAEIQVVNTCVVRQSAENEGLGRIHELQTLKRTDPSKIIGVMGCMVGVKTRCNYVNACPC
ncbi:MAG UNVERIFIED_CONTAM: hypothetical protein LVT10_05035 [Anaerolineae bacterium]